MTFSLQTFQERQHKFAELMEVNTAALFLSASTQHRNSDVEQKFRQDSSFWYLTGFNEPDSALLIIKTKTEVSTFIFARPREKDKEIWTGRRSGPEGAKEICGAQNAFEFKLLDEILEKKLIGLEHFYFNYADDHYQLLRSKILETVKGKRIQKISSTQNLIGELRLLKSEDELHNMRKAAAITVQAHNLAFNLAADGIPEYFLEAKIEGLFRENNANWAYPSIVASGRNATVLHYVENNKILQAGEFLLIDAGCEFEYYASDVTRTFPVGGVFTKSQKEIYDLVLSSQKAAIERTKIKDATFVSVHDEAVKVLSQGLLDLQLLKGSFDEVLEQKTFRKFYMHQTSHWLGLDVHDTGSYTEPYSGGQSRILRPGMVLTIEPGLYFDPDDDTIPSAYRGLGIRIEDDVLIQDNGIEILTQI
jgi:Xaa-Pro aminopeptidase